MCRRYVATSAAADLQAKRFHPFGLSKPAALHHTVSRHGLKYGLRLL